MVLKPVAARRRAVVPADLDAPHSWTYVGDVARLLVELADREPAWGQAWHVPSAAPISIRAAAARASALAGLPPPRLSVLPSAALRLIGVFAPVAGESAKFARELVEVSHQRTGPWILDSSRAEAAFGIVATPLESSLGETMAHIRAGSGEVNPAVDVEHLTGGE